MNEATENAVSAGKTFWETYGNKIKKTGFALLCVVIGAAAKTGYDKYTAK